jgi:hypothetical protein
MPPSSSLEESLTFPALCRSPEQPSHRCKFFAVETGIRGAQTGCEFHLVEWPGRWRAGERLFVCRRVRRWSALRRRRQWIQLLRSGQPITWQGGVVNYYTEQGSLSPLLPGASADAFVATAFASWSGVTTAALQINHAGQLSEDVSGSNVQNGGSLILPVDIQPNSPKSIAMIYDYDGSVIATFLGTGAGSEDLCDSNSVISVADNFTANGHDGQRSSSATAIVPSIRKTCRFCNIESRGSSDAFSGSTGRSSMKT